MSWADALGQHRIASCGASRDVSSTAQSKNVDSLMIRKQGPIESFFPSVVGGGF
jgi:hypothetical protein